MRLALVLKLEVKNEGMNNKNNMKKKIFQTSYILAVYADIVCYGWVEELHVICWLGYQISPQPKPR